MKDKIVNKKKQNIIWLAFLSAMLVGLVVGERTVPVLARYPIIMWVRITEVIVGLILLDDLLGFATQPPTSPETGITPLGLRILRGLHSGYKWTVCIIAMLDVLILVILVGCELAR